MPYKEMGKTEKFPLLRNSDTVVKTLTYNCLAITWTIVHTMSHTHTTEIVEKRREMTRYPTTVISKIPEPKKDQVLALLHKQN